MKATASKHKRGRESVYYAHAKCIFGRFDEQRELRLIRRRFRRARIVNPAESNSDDPYSWALSISFYLDLIDECTIVVFSRCRGKITTGVGKEVNHALKTGKAVFELKAGKLVPRRRRVKYISQRSTRLLFKRYRAQPDPHAAGRKRIAAAQRARWAKVKRTALPRKARMRASL